MPTNLYIVSIPSRNEERTEAENKDKALSNVINRIISKEKGIDFNNKGYSNRGIALSKAKELYNAGIIKVIEVKPESITINIPEPKVNPQMDLFKESYSMKDAGAFDIPNSTGLLIPPSQTAPLADFKYFERYDPNQKGHKPNLSQPSKLKNIVPTREIPPPFGLADDYQKLNPNMFFDLGTDEFNIRRDRIRGFTRVLAEIKNKIAAKTFTWSELQKKYPSYTSKFKNEFLKLFEDKKSISVEDIEQDLSAIGTGKYETTYTTWEGGQRIKRIPQLVLQINKTLELDNVLSSDSQLKEFVSKIIELSYRSGHPVIQDKTIGWFRVAKVTPDLLLVDEIQSDVLKISWGLKMQATEEYRQLRESLKEKYTDEDIDRLNSKLVEIFSDWQEEAMSTILEIARNHQIKEVGVHTQESTALKGEGASWVKSIYEGIAKQFGFKKEMREIPEHGSVELFIRQAKKLISYSMLDIIKEAGAQEDIRDLNSEGINKYIEKGQDLYYLFRYAKDLLTPEHINKIIEKGRNLYYLFKDAKDLLTPEHINILINRYIEKGQDLEHLFRYAKDLLTPEHINKIIEKGQDLEHLFRYAKDLLTPEHINKIIEKGQDLDYLIRHAKDLLTPEHINKINKRKKQKTIEKLPEYDTEKLPDVSQLQFKDVLTIIKKDMLKEGRRASILDYPKPGLCPSIWDENGKMLTIVKDQIINKLLKFFKSQDIDLMDKDIVSKIMIIGSLTSYQYAKNSDLDCHIHFSIDKILDTFNLPAEELAELIDDKWRKELNTQSELIKNTQHPLEFYFEMEGYTSVAEPTDGVYDLFADKWVKEPRTVDMDFDINEKYPEIIEYASNLAKEIDGEIGSIHRDIKDIQLLQETIQTFSKDKQKLFLDKLQNKIDEVERDIQDIVEKGLKVIKDRHIKYNPYSKENITFKYLQRYLYFDLIKSIKNILVNEKTDKVEVNTIDDVNKVEEIIDEF